MVSIEIGIFKIYNMKTLFKLVATTLAVASSF